MANSRYDNIKYFADGSFHIPQQIKVYNGSAWIDLGAKDSYSTKKLNVMHNNNFLCATYYRHDVNIPKSVTVGSGSKYLTIYKPNGTLCRINNWRSGYTWDMTVEVYSSTCLYTCYVKNNGDITNQAYINYIVDVNGEGRARLRLKSRFHGTSLSTRKYVNASSEGQTSYCFDAGQKVRILVTKNEDNGKNRIRIYNASGTLLTDQWIYETTLMVATPNEHRLGCETTNDSGRQSAYGEARIHKFKFTPDSNNNFFEVNINGLSNGQTKINSIGGYSGYLQASNTSVQGSQYTEYIRQTV